MFLIAITIYYQFVNNLSSDSEDEINEMVLDSKTISNSLISGGYPFDWNTSNVKRIGLTEGNYRVSKEKLDNFANISYSTARGTIFDTRFNFYFQLKDKEGGIIPINGGEGVGIAANNTGRLVQISRVAIYNSSIVKMVLYLW